MVKATQFNRPTGAHASYHHGDLRASLVLAAREALRTSAPEAVSMKSLAEGLGVSQPAPYRHFPSRDALLAAVAEDGFQRFGLVLKTAAAASPADLALERVCIAYVEFASSNIGAYLLMFSRRSLDGAPKGSVLAREADASLSLLVDLVSRRIGPENAPKTAMTIWSTLHGAVSLAAEGLLSQPTGPHTNAKDIVSNLIEALARDIRPV